MLQRFCDPRRNQDHPQFLAIYQYRAITSKFKPNVAFLQYSNPFRRVGCCNIATNSSFILVGIDLYLDLAQYPEP